MGCLPAIDSGAATVLVGTIAALVGAVSWLGKSVVSSFLWYHAKLTREVERMVALKAEIQANVQFQRTVATEAFLKRAFEQIEADAYHKFFIPLYREDIVFDVVKSDVTTLPAGPINEVVDYYNKSNGMDVVLGRLEEPRFEEFYVKRKKAVLTSLQALARDVVVSGESAMAKLDDQVDRSQFQKYLLLGLVAVITLLGARAAYGAYTVLKAFAAACITPS